MPSGTPGGFVDNSAAVGLPPLLARRFDVYAYYRLEFLADGYPGRRTERGLHAHPIYGTYIIADYLAQYTSQRDPRYLDGARRVADAAIARMEAIGDALAFWYEPADGISSLPSRFYSALTQARYLQVLARLHRHTRDERYREAAQAILRSLRVPVEAGGVMRRHDPGVMIEEYAHRYPDYTLNGWTTAMLLIHDYGNTMGDPGALELFDANVIALRDVIHLYDVPELANTRYRLTGPATLRINFDRPGPKLPGGHVLMPRRGDFPIGGQDAERWENRFKSGLAEDMTVKEASVVAEIYLSMVTHPTQNAIRLVVETPQPVGIRLAIGQGRYRPRSSYLAARSYAEFAAFRVEAGTHAVEAEIPWANMRLVAYPTSFGKNIAGRNYNQYHFIHVDNLAKLHERTGEASFGHWADVWRQYPARWSEIAEYQEDIALDRYTP